MNKERIAAITVFEDWRLAEVTLLDDENTVDLERSPISLHQLERRRGRAVVLSPDGNCQKKIRDRRVRDATVTGE
jgi:hypothetical protein